MIKSNLIDNLLYFKLASPDEISLTLGQRLKDQRLAKNLKQQELAGRAGVSVGTVKNLESKGQSSLDSLVRIVSALDLVQDLDSLFTVKLRSIAQMEKLEKLSAAKPRMRARDKLKK